jgi:hypothetical protein
MHQQQLHVLAPSPVEQDPRAALGHRAPAAKVGLNDADMVA